MDSTEKKYKLFKNSLWTNIMCDLKETLLNIECRKTCCRNGVKVVHGHEAKECNDVVLEWQKGAAMRHPPLHRLAMRSPTHPRRKEPRRLPSEPRKQWSAHPPLQRARGDPNRGRLLKTATTPETHTIYPFRRFRIWQCVHSAHTDEFGV